MRATKTIGHRKYMGVLSAAGYPGAPMFDPPDTQPATLRASFGWHPQASDVKIGDVEYTQRVIASMVVGVPDVTPYAPGDLVILNGNDYVVSEDVRDYTNGPFSRGPGGEIVVERVTG